MDRYDSFRTLPGMLQYVLNTYRNTYALNYKYLGRWEHISTEKFVKQVRRLTLGLKSIGVERGDRFGIIVPPSPQWVMIDLALMVNGAVSVPMFPDISSSNFNFEVADCNMKYLFIKNKNELNPAIQQKLNDFKTVIALDIEDQGKNVINYFDILDKGDTLSSQDPQLYSILRDSVDENDLATIIYTSGSTGIPKGAMLTHRNLVSQVKGATQRFPLDPTKDKVLSCLPLAHVFERMVMYFYISTGTSIYFADDIKKVGDIMREVKPTVITMVPRLLEKVYAKMHNNLSEVSGLKKFLVTKAFHLADTKLPTEKSLFSKIFDRLVYKKLRAALGDHLRLVICGSAKLHPDVERFFRNIGLPLYQGYGLTECSPVVAANYPGNNKEGTVGPAFPDVDIKISNEGEILVSSPGVFKGYNNNPTATAEMIDQEGWLHTGDLGQIDSNGHIIITGRKKELFKTSNGKYVSPTVIEQAVCQNPLIDMATIVAEGRNFVSVLLFPDMENVEKIRSEMGTKMTNEEFLMSKAVLTEMDHLIDSVNIDLNHWEQIRKYHIISNPVSIESGELTPTMKIRRHVVEEKYAKEINDLYNE